jgi:hypothetical protein
MTWKTRASRIWRPVWTSMPHLCGRRAATGLRSFVDPVWRLGAVAGILSEVLGKPAAGPKANRGLAW